MSKIFGYSIKMSDSNVWKIPMVVNRLFCISFHQIRKWRNCIKDKLWIQKYMWNWHWDVPSRTIIYLFSVTIITKKKKIYWPTFLLKELKHFKCFPLFVYFNKWHKLYIQKNMISFSLYQTWNLAVKGRNTNHYTPLACV